MKRDDLGNKYLAGIPNLLVSLILTVLGLTIFFGMPGCVSEGSDPPAKNRRNPYLTNRKLGD